MCGIAGVALSRSSFLEDGTLLAMARTLRHRGPDGYGIYTAAGTGFAHTRLSVLDIEQGDQPMGTEDGALHIVFNGEIFNHVELRARLGSRGHRFRTRSDTEVLLHAYREWGADALEELNGQFAFVIHDARSDELFLARDRFGIRPLYYAETREGLVFASEVKALFASGMVSPELDAEGLDEVFTFWAARPPRTVFRGVRSLEPGSYARWRDGRLSVHRYYEPDFPEERREPTDVLRAMDDRMWSSVGLRMRSDVPVGGYLSGGLDSSITAAMATRMSPRRLRTFSITFEDPELDEGVHQALVAEAVRSRHLIRVIARADVADVFPDVIRHTETPLVRTAPAPLYLLSRRTQEQGIKVVLTGEGADEVFLGYDLFKETRVRRFCLRRPESVRRPRLFDRLYPYLDGSGRTGVFWRRSFLDAGSPDDPLFSHLPRIRLTSTIKHFYSAGMRDRVGGFDPLEELRSSLPPAFAGWSALNRAAYLEMVTLLSPYLLSSQGDRMAMAHGVEGRFPFLDHEVFEMAAALPTNTKLRGLKEKDVLRRWAQRIVPPSIMERPKQPYRAPDAEAFFGGRTPAWVTELLGAPEVDDAGIFDAHAVAGLVKRCREGKVTGFRENQALVAILSTQVWRRVMLEASWNVVPLPLAGARVVLRGGSPCLGRTTMVF